MLQCSLLLLINKYMEHDIEHKVEHKVEHKKQDGYKTIAGAIIIAGILIAGAILLKGQTGTQPINPNEANLKNIKLKPISSDEHIQGNLNAKVTIVEYSDTECPFSKRFHGVMQQVLAKYGDKISYVYRHFPLDCADATDLSNCRTLHALARSEAEATECAFEQGGNDVFSKYTDTIFQTTTSNDGLDPAEITKIAQSMGLNMEQFNTCIKDRKYKNKVSEQAKSGRDAGVTGTPKSFILKKGKIVDTIDGAFPYEAVVQKIDAALK